MKLNEAIFCPDCEEIFKRGIITGQHCPACTNRSTITLNNLLFTKQELVDKKMADAVKAVKKVVKK